MKRITGSQRNQKFMGTDLTYADMESRDLEKSELKRLADGKVGGNTVYVIEAIPKDDADSQYGKTVTFVHKESWVPLKVEFYDKKLRPLKTMQVRRLEKKDGRWVATDSIIKNSQEGSQTEMVINNIDFSVKLSDSLRACQACRAGSCGSRLRGSRTGSLTAFCLR